MFLYGRTCIAVGIVAYILIFQTACQTTRTSSARQAKRGLFFSGNEATSLRWPIYGKINSPFGRRNGRMHTGIDIDGNSGEPVRAAASGIVTIARRASGYGKTIILRHRDNRITLYAHLSAINVDEGDRVDRGEVIGRVGQSGHATGPHLHFEVRNYRNFASDPLGHLPKQNDTLLSQD